jgi:hypothetical protein
MVVSLAPAAGSRTATPKRLNELMNDPDPDRSRRATEAMLKMGKIDVAELERAANAA